MHAYQTPPKQTPQYWDNGARIGLGEWGDIEYKNTAQYNKATRRAVWSVPAMGIYGQYMSIDFKQKVYVAPRSISPKKWHEKRWT